MYPGQSNNIKQLQHKNQINWNVAVKAVYV